jgi:threonine dehydrogenase-like Zn-dependent dehydrogenase
MRDFPRTIVGGVSVSRLIAGANGRLIPAVGLAFAWNTIRDQDMVTVGTTTPDEARECIDLSLDFLARRLPENQLQMGAALVLDPRDPATPARIWELTGGAGVDCALDCSGTVEAQRLCIDATRRRGRVAFVGESLDQLHLTVSNDMIRKGLTLIGNWHYNLAHYAGIMQVIRQSPLIDLLISHVMPMRDVAKAFDLQISGQCAKILLKPCAV